MGYGDSTKRPPFGWPLLLVGILTLGLGGVGKGQDSFTDEQLEFFESKVRPLLIERCFDCHGPEAAPLEGNLSLASRQSILTGGDSGPAVVPGHADESLLIDSINYGDLYEMPPDTKMSEEEIGILTRWVEMGAPWPPEEGPDVRSESGFDLEQRRAEHWCWQPVQAIAPPAVQRSDWVRDPLDAFVLRRLEDAGIDPADQADRRTLLRRLSFDLTGLPPTAEEIENYLNDPSPDATARVVDRLLASPKFGEHWARHWLDLMRYAETCGHEFDYPIPNAWRYRDYVIRAFNEDVPYDQFVREHIAGDLLENPRRHPTEQYNESILATGSWFLGEDVHGPVDVRADLAGHYDNQIDVMGKSFLGLTISCARCHDHKFDAISTRDFYALAGYLKSSRRQDVMLDPGRRIEAGLAAIETGREAMLPAWQTLLSQLARPDAEQFSDYLHAALDILRHDPDWNQVAGTRVPGEKLTVAGKPSGIVEPQTIAARGDFAWEGDQQLWWRDGAIGDRLEVNWNHAGGVPGEFELWGNFTQAPDYGRATLAWNGEVVKSDLEFFAPALAVTGRMLLGRVQVKPGDNSLSVEITGHHEQAIPRHMVGIDYLELVPVDRQASGEPIDLVERAAAAELNPEILTRLVEAIRRPELSRADHPLHVIQLASRRSFDLAGNPWQQLADGERANRELAEQFQQQTELFADFDDGLPSGWFPTGFAFGEPNDGERPAVAGEISPPTGTLHSGLLGKSAQGVIRSPTFVIGHDRIHFRLRGEKIQLRLIIEGYVLDVYNALLFNGLNIQRERADSFEWITMGGDLRNHRGLRAHLEIIDQGDGWVELDEIRFSNDASSGPRPSNRVTEQVAAAGDQVDSVEKLAEQVALSAADAVRHPSPDSTWVSWIVEHGLAGALADDGSTISLADSESDFRSPIELERDLRQQWTRLRELDRDISAPEIAMGLTDGTGEDEYVYIRGNHKNLGELAPRGFLTALDPDRETHPTDGSSGRLLLAEAIASPSNPLTARVVVNRLWHHLMGRGIVGSVDNFGVLGQSPTHPELLDYLASELVASDWSLKQMIRRIVLSQTYQMASVDAPATASLARETDPANWLLHRANIKRISGESLRDAMLQIAGRLDDTQFGPPVPIHLTPFMQGRGRPGQSGPLDGEGRRSIYISVRRNFLSPMMLAFDTPIPFNAIGRRNRSNVPAQALILMNSPLVLQMAGTWAENLLAEEADFETRVERAYIAAFAEPPTAEEKQLAAQFFEEQAQLLGLDQDAALANSEIWTDFCHVLFNVKNFIYIH